MAPRTPLFHPREYFGERGFSLGPAAGAVVAAVVALTAALLGFAVLLSNRLAAAGHADATDAVWGAVGSYLVGVVFALLVGWLVVAIVLHLVGRVALSHDGRFEQTLAVAGWGMAPSVIGTVVAFVVLALALGDASMASPEAFVDQFRANLASAGGVQLLVGLALAGWQTYVYGGGLAVEFDAPAESAYGAGALVAFGGWLLSLF